MGNSLSLEDSKSISNKILLDDDFDKINYIPMFGSLLEIIGSDDIVKFEKIILHQEILKTIFLKYNNSLEIHINFQDFNIKNFNSQCDINYNELVLLVIIHNLYKSSKIIQNISINNEDLFLKYVRSKLPKDSLAIFDFVKNSFKTYISIQKSKICTPISSDVGDYLVKKLTNISNKSVMIDGPLDYDNKCICSYIVNKLNYQVINFNILIFNTQTHLDLIKNLILILQSEAVIFSDVDDILIDVDNKLYFQFLKLIDFIRNKVKLLFIIPNNLYSFLLISRIVDEIISVDNSFDL